MSVSISSVGKAFKILPKVIDLIADVEAKIQTAKAANSAGGSKVTAIEIAKIVTSELGPLVDAIVEIVT